MNPERSRIAIDTKCHHSTSEITQTKIDGRPIGWQVEFITCTVGDTTYSGCSRSRPFALWRVEFRAVRVAGCWTRSIRIGVRSWARALAAEIIAGLRWGCRRRCLEM